MWRIRWVLIATGVLGCTPSAHFTVESAPDFVPGPTTVSVLGVFHDGRMSADAWDQIGQSLSQPFHEALCPGGYGQPMRAKQPELADRVDRSTREDGLSDELMNKVAPMAQGELVMAVTLYHYVPPKPAAQPAAAPVAAPAMPAGGSRRGGGGGAGRSGRGSGPRSSAESVEDSVFEISVTFFSVKRHEMVARVDMRYSGDDVDQATRELQAKLVALLPQSHCVGWAW